VAQVDPGAGGGSTRPRTLALFPEDRCEGVLPDASIVRLKLSQLRLERPRQWGACWLALQLWQELRLDRFWGERPTAGRKGTRWDEVLFVLVAYRLIAPGSEWRLYREWYAKSALADLLGADAALAAIRTLYRCHAVAAAVTRVAEAALVLLRERRIGLQVRARQIVQQHLEAGVEQIAPAPHQMIEHRRLVLQKPVRGFPDLEYHGDCGDRVVRNPKADILEVVCRASSIGRSPAEESVLLGPATVFTESPA